jgi:twitching motility protein PilT
MAAIDILLSHMVKAQASDLHLSSGRVPMVRLNGDIVPVAGMPPLESGVLEQVLTECLPEASRTAFATESDIDFAYAIAGTGRFRCNIFRDEEGICGVFRHIPERIPTVEQLGLPEVVRTLCDLEDGLVVITGPTGSGKSTTLAAMIDHINRTKQRHIVTIEDPVEFRHRTIRSLVNQREVGTHTRTFARALKAALREDPDVVLVGEMRDLETVEIALETAETGHLVLSTLHTGTAMAAVDRIVDQFPAEKQAQVRVLLSASLRAVVAQTLLRRKDGRGRAAAHEVLVVTRAVAANIREGRTHQIESALQTGGKHGMACLNESILRLVKDGVVSAADGYAHAVDKVDLERRMALEKIAIPRSLLDPDAAPAGTR